MIISDWVAEAERLKFDEGKSWTEVYATMKPFFPDLTDKQIEERVRMRLRKSKRYHAAAVPVGHRDHFSYESDGDVTVYLLADLHCGAHGFVRKRFEEYVARIEEDDTAAVLVLGDLMDNATQGSKGCTFSQRNSPQKQIETVIEMLDPIKEKIRFFCIGNHEERTFRQTGSDPGFTMCLGLGCLDKYNYVHGFITVRARGKTYKIYATHNIGRGEAKLKTMARSHPDCDIVCGGHIHQTKVIPVAQQLHNGKIRTTYAVTNNAWLKDESYSISGAYEPVDMTPPIIRLGEGIRVEQ